MGITVHFEGRLRGEAAYASLIEAAKAFASRLGWKVLPISESNIELMRVREEQDWNYVGPTKGVELLAHADCEPIRLEFDRELYVQEYTKTQFAPPDVHKAFVALLDALAPYFHSLVVFDESEYYETRNAELFESHCKSFWVAFHEQLSQDPLLRGPVHMESGRIADLVRDA